MSKAIDPEIKEQRAVEKIKVENEHLKSINKKLLRADKFNVIDDLREILSKSPKPFEVTLNNTNTVASAKQDHSEIAALIWSDFHISECISDVETNKANKFNSVIASNRISSLIESTKQVLRFHSTAYNIEKIWIAVLGDMVSGSHIEDLELTNDLDDGSAAILAARLLHLALLDLKQLGIPIELDCTVGNHGRLNSKLSSKRVGYTTWDYVVFEMLAFYFKDDPQVTVRVHTGHIVPVKQFGHKFILTHGTNIKASKLESIEDTMMATFDSKTYREFTGETGTSYDIILCGHMHRSIIRDKIIVNSSLGGQSELGMMLKLHPLINASQTAFGISRKHPRTWLYNLDVGSVRSEKAENAYSKYAKEFLKKHGRN